MDPAIDKHQITTPNEYLDSSCSIRHACDESKDKRDSYLSRFEKYTMANKWDKSVCAAVTECIAEGRALDAYDRFTTEHAADYDTLKDAFWIFLYD